MDVGSATGADKLFLVTPMILKHEINQKSPFWNFSASDLMNEQFEIIVLLEGTVERKRFYFFENRISGYPDFQKIF